jgi:hypothetical protein
VLTFSTSRDGFSLNTLYRKMDVLEESPILIIIEDTRDRVRQWPSMSYHMPKRFRYRYRIVCDPRHFRTILTKPNLI